MTDEALQKLKRSMLAGLASEDEDAEDDRAAKQRAAITPDDQLLPPDPSLRVGDDDNEDW